MKISELRELIKKYKEDELRSIITEMYKAMPAKLRDEKNIDNIISDYHMHVSKGKDQKDQSIKIDFDQLKRDVEKFINHAYEQYYFAPNNVIHKKNRPKWRFMVKAFIKDLQTVPVESDDATDATELIKKLYEMLCYACGRYIFNSEDPFRSVGIEQTVLYDSIISRMFYTGINADTIKAAIKLAIDNNTDRETLHSSLINILISYLMSTDARITAINQCKSLLVEYKKQNQTKRVKIFGDIERYKRERIINDLSETVFKLYGRLCEYDAAIEYFYQNYNYDDNDNEIKLYVMLNMLRDLNQKDYWIREYESAVAKGVVPRDRLSKKYDYIKTNDKFPESIDYLYKTESP